ncbi:MAG: hypothetical protein FJ265_08750 [Planctomycetes bacterium]|nr:hypothetical protein [Planctomycetota bacterium]
MLLPLSSLGLWCASAGTGPANLPGAPHAVAFVNDSRSHGFVGDGFLSLNEAIQLHNNTLATSLLSPAELLQIQLIPGTGTSTLLSWAVFDGSSTPIVTVERDLDPILDTSYGFYVSSFNEPTALDFTGPGIAHGLRVPANSVELKDLILVGGPYGIDAMQTTVAGQAGLVLRNVRCENQALFGVRVRTSTANGVGRLYAERCTVVGTGTAFAFLENVAGRTSICELHDCRIQGAQRGVEIEVGSGGTGRYTLDRLSIDATVSGIRLLRPGGGDRSALIESGFVDVRAPLGARLDTAPTGVTWATLRLWTVRATIAGGTALQLGALGDALYGDLEDCTFDGALSVLAGGGPLPLALANVRCRNGAVSFGTSATQPLSLAWSRFDQCSVQTTGSSPVAAADCCFVGGSAAGTVLAPLVCGNSYVQVPGPHLVQTGALPAPQLGSLSLQPEVVTLGNTASFQADLPAGLFGVFVLGFTDPAPSLLAQPLHLYSQPAATFTLPGVYRFQQSFAWPIPNQQLFLGLDLCVHLAVLPDPNVLAPAVQLPPGRRFVLQ